MTLGLLPGHKASNGRLRILFLFLALALVGGACGEQQPDETGQAGEQAGETETSSPRDSPDASPTDDVTDIQEITVAMPGTGYWQAPIRVAQERGILSDHGLDVELITTSSGSETLAGLIGGSADLAIVAYDHVLRAAAQGQPVVAVGNLLLSHITNVSASERIEADPSDPLADRVSALKGTRIALPGQGGSAEVLLRTLLEDEGLSIADVEVVYLGGDPSAYVGAIEAGRVDAGVYVEPAGLVLEQRGMGEILINVMAGDMPALEDVLFMPIVVERSELENSEQVIDRLIAALSESIDFLKNGDREEVLGTLEDVYPDLDPEFQEPMLEAHLPVWSESLEVSLESAERMRDFFVRTGDLEEDEAPVEETLP